MTKIKYVILSFFFVTHFAAKAQYAEFGLGLGGSLYYGDLSAPDLSTNLSTTKFAAQTFIRYVPNKNLAFKANLLVGGLEGDDRLSKVDFQQVRNLRFKSIFIESSLMGEYYLFGYDAREGTQLFSPYVTIGLGLFYFNPKADYLGDTYALQPLGTEGQGLSGRPGKYSRVVLAIPFGGGFKFKINEKYNFGLALLARRTFTDYIDDLSTNYADINELASAYGPISAALSNRQGEALGTGPINIPGSQRGGSRVKDYYFSIMANVSINLESILGIGKNEHTPDCPHF